MLPKSPRDPYLLGSPGSSMGWAAAPVWPANKIPNEYRAAQSSPVETLMLSGSLDVSTPARNARDQLLPLLENGEQVILSEFAHTGDLINLQPEATRHLLTTFLTPAISILALQLNPVNFKPKWGLPLIAKLAVGGCDSDPDRHPVVGLVFNPSSEKTITAARTLM